MSLLSAKFGRLCGYPGWGSTDIVVTTPLKFCVGPRIYVKQTQRGNGDKGKGARQDEPNSSAGE